jgi:hypothetical protein
MLSIQLLLLSLIESPETVRRVASSTPWAVLLLPVPPTALLALLLVILLLLLLAGVILSPPLVSLSLFLSLLLSLSLPSSIFNLLKNACASAAFLPFGSLFTLILPGKKVGNSHRVSQKEKRKRIQAHTDAVSGNANITIPLTVGVLHT